MNVVEESVCGRFTQMMSWAEVHRLYSLTLDPFIGRIEALEQGTFQHFMWFVKGRQGRTHQNSERADLKRGRSHRGADTCLDYLRIGSGPCGRPSGDIGGSGLSGPRWKWCATPGHNK